jgi:uncharacterized membrane protein YkvA (DUF1232 family)
MDRKEGYFERFKSSASEYLDDKIKLNQLLEKARRKMDKGRSQLNEAWDTIQVFYRMMRSYVKGEYRNIPNDKLLLIIAAFIYLVSPIDAIIDFLPGGLIDDGAIFIWLLSSLSEEIRQYREWEKQNNLQP